jgi:uncharacterized protein
VNRPETGWIRTYTGKKFWPLSPSPEDVDIKDIAHSLAMKCRYGGMATEFYSVAQHCVLVSDACMAQDKLWGLLHDAEEAYSPFGDIPRPIKHQMPDELLAINARIQGAVCHRFGMPKDEPLLVKHADNCIIYDEKPILMRDADLACMPGTYPLGIKIVPWTWQEAETRFLDRFAALWGAR